MTQHLNWIIGIGTGVLLALGSAATAQSDTTTLPPGEGVDCTEVIVRYVDDPTLTRAERIAAMDRALYHSLSKFDACQNEAKSTSTEGAVKGGDSGGGAVSTASSDMTGTESAQTPASASRSSPEPAGTTPENDGSHQSWTKPSEPGPQTAQNGKIPEDIPPGDNDSVLEAQIRQAAVNERDPEIQARLWNEYRRYKGLPPVE